MPVYEATVTSKGQITIPIEMRRFLQLKTGDTIEFFEDYRGAICVRPCNAAPTDFLNAVPARKKLMEFATDDDALGAEVVSRNLPSGKKQAA